MYNENVGETENIGYIMDDAQKIKKIAQSITQQNIKQNVFTWFCRMISTEMIRFQTLDYHNFPVNKSTHILANFRNKKSKQFFLRTP